MGIPYIYHSFESYLSATKNSTVLSTCFNLFWGTKREPNFGFCWLLILTSHSNSHTLQPLVAPRPFSPIPIQTPHHQHWDRILPRMSHHHFARGYSARPTWDGAWLKTDSQQLAIEKDLEKTTMKPIKVFCGTQILEQNLTYLNFYPAHPIKIQVEFTKSFCPLSHGGITV